jgi:hypothetical protein
MVGPDRIRPQAQHSQEVLFDLLSLWELLALLRRAKWSVGKTEDAQTGAALMKELAVNYRTSLRRRATQGHLV